MGVFDDAIREHLELKRDRGTPESELERQEREAFGRDDSGESLDDRQTTVDGVSVEEAERTEALVIEQRAVKEEETELPEEVEAPEFLEHIDDLGEIGEEEEDVLEDTPEFLQESPEHDSMWFEQRPPKDFDFDE